MFVGLDASKKTTSICVVNRDGEIVEEGVVDTSPKAILAFLRGRRRRYIRVGMEAWAMAAWLYEGLARGGLPIVVIETRAAHSMLKITRNKTDRNDARGIAQMVRARTYRSVHIKSAESQRILAMLTARALLAEKAQDISNAIGGVLLTAGLKLSRLKRRTFELRVRALVEKRPAEKMLVDSLLAARAALLRERDAMDAALIATADADPVCRRLMTAPGVGPRGALLFRCAVDQPQRFTKSRAVGAHFGLTARVIQSGGTTIYGRITCWGDAAVRRMLVLAAWQLMRRNARTSWLSTWVKEIAARRGSGKAIVAGARRLAILMHRMWVSETDFQWETPVRST